MTQERAGVQLSLEDRKDIARRAQERAISRTSRRGSADEIWEGSIGMPFMAGLGDWITSKGSWMSSSAGMDVNLSSHDMESNNSSGDLARALRSTSGHLTVEAILEKALEEVRQLENDKGIRPVLTRSYILEEFIPLLVTNRNVGKKRAGNLVSRARQRKLQVLN